MNTRTIARITRLKLKAIEYKGGSCERCGYNKNLKALEFHHIDPKEKDFGIAQVRTKSFKKIQKELDKCILVCSNCHSEIHDELWRSDKTVNWELYNSLLNEWPEFRQRTVYKCKTCNSNKVSGVNRNCITCRNQNQEKILWPSDTELKKLIWSMPKTKLAKKLQVSDRAITKRCVAKNIPQPPRGYWLKNNH